MTALTILVVGFWLGVGLLACWILADRWIHKPRRLPLAGRQPTRPHVHTIRTTTPYDWAVE